MAPGILAPGSRGAPGHRGRHRRLFGHNLGGSKQTNNNKKGAACLKVSGTGGNQRCVKMEKHKASRETRFIYKLLDRHKQWGGRLLSHPEMEKNLAQWEKLAVEPQLSACPAASGDCPGCSSAACPELYPRRVGMRCLWLPPKLHHNKLCTGDGKELHSTMVCGSSLKWQGAPTGGLVWG